MSQINGTLVTDHRHADEGLVVDHGREVNRVEDVSVDVRRVAHVGPILRNGKVPINVGLDPHGAVTGRRLVEVRPVERHVDDVVASQQIRREGYHGLNQVGVGVHGRVEPRAVETEIIIPESVR